VYNQLEHPQTVAGGGAALQLGLPTGWRRLPVGHLRVAPGLESGLLYLQREIEPVSAFYQEKPASLTVAMPFAGALLRVEYALPGAPRWKVSVEAASDVLFAVPVTQRDELVRRGSGPADDFDVSQSFTLNV